MANPFAGLVRRLDMERFAARRDAQFKHLAKVKRLPLRQQITALGRYEREALRNGGKLPADDPVGIYFNKRVRPLLAKVDAERSFRNAQRMEAVVAARDTLGEHSSDAAVRAWAWRRAGEAVALVGSKPEEDEQWRYCTARWFVQSWGFEPPPLAEGEPLGPSLARMTCPRWWRRKARRLVTLDIERRAIEGGKVHRKAGVYVSDANVARGQAQDERNAQLLLNLVAVNELGEQFSLADLADKSLSNPHVRFSELMVRLKGMEAVADRLGYVGLFLTWTLESRYHARLSKSGSENPKWTADKLTPRQGQLRLRELWAQARAALAKLHARYFGVRVAEPHHDGTPHWHLLMFVRPDQREAVTATLRSYAMLDSPDEDGAADARFTVKLIDKGIGGATSYVAKYISKNTSGAKLGKRKERGADGVVRETGEAEEGAKRVRRWAGVHGIRQFQAFGVPPIGIWRELRRMDGPAPTELPNGMPVRAELWARLEGARQAADEGDYGRHLQRLGGPALPRAEQPIALLRDRAVDRVDADGVIPVNAYGEPAAPRTVGVCFRLRIPLAMKPRQRRRRYHTEIAGRFVTRLHQWVLKRRAEGDAVAVSVAVENSDTSQGAETATPWTRVNNCNRRASDQGQTTGHPPDFQPPETPPWPPAAPASPASP